MSLHHRAHPSISDVLDSLQAGSEPEALAALTHLPRLRAELDVLERGLIDAARRAGASWVEIAAALRLRSRQAAEQRRLRLGNAETGAAPGDIRAQRRRQQNIDKQAGTGIIALRAAASRLADSIEVSTPAPALGLALSTLRIAADADPGSLVDLVRWAIADLDAAASIPTDVVNRLPAVRTALESL